MKKLFINFKSNYDKKCIDEFISKINNLNIKKDFVVCPSYIYLNDFICNGFKVCAQDVSKYPSGAYTGEVSASELKSIETSYVLIGHYERRQLFKETNKDISMKLKEAIKNNLKVILCINKLGDLKVLDGINYKNISIAYEPAEFIGTQCVKNINELKKDIAKIKKLIYNQYCCNIEVLYGGGVDDTNVDELNNELDVDGFLISTAALDFKKFLKIKEVIL